MDAERTQMLWLMAVVVVALWFLGWVTSYTLGGFLHVLLALALAVLILRSLGGRRPF